MGKVKSLFMIVHRENRFVPKSIYFRTHNSKSLEEENLRLFIAKCNEILGIKKIFGDEKEKVFRNFSNFPIVLNAIAQLSEKSERSKTRLKPKVKYHDVLRPKWV